MVQVSLQSVLHLASGSKKKSILSCEEEGEAGKFLHSVSFISLRGRISDGVYARMQMTRLAFTNLRHI